MLNTGQLAPLSSRSSPGRHASPPSYLTGVPASYSPLHGPDSGITMLTTRYCKLVESFAAFVHMAAWIIESRPSARDIRPPQYKADARPAPVNTQIGLATA